MQNPESTPPKEDFLENERLKKLKEAMDEYVNENIGQTRATGAAIHELKSKFIKKFKIDPKDVRIIHPNFFIHEGKMKFDKYKRPY